MFPSQKMSIRPPQNSTPSNLQLFPESCINSPLHKFYWPLTGQAIRHGRLGVLSRITLADLLPLPPIHRHGPAVTSTTRPGLREPNVSLTFSLWLLSPPQTLTACPRQCTLRRSPMRASGSSIRSIQGESRFGGRRQYCMVSTSKCCRRHQGRQCGRDSARGCLGGACGCGGFVRRGPAPG